MSVELLQTLSLSAYIAAGVFLVTTVALFFLLDIPGVLGDLTGATARKAIEDIRTQTETGNAPVRRRNAGRKTEKDQERDANVQPAGSAPKTDRKTALLRTGQKTKLLRPDRETTELRTGPDTTELKTGADTTELRSGPDTMVLGTSPDTTVLRSGPDTMVLGTSPDTTVLNTGEPPVEAAPAQDFPSATETQDRDFVVEEELGFSESDQIIP